MVANLSQGENWTIAETGTKIGISMLYWDNDNLMRFMSVWYNYQEVWTVLNGNYSTMYYTLQVGYIQLESSLIIGVCLKAGSQYT